MLGRGSRASGDYVGKVYIQEDPALENQVSCKIKKPFDDEDFKDAVINLRVVSAMIKK
jgi:hypothetical protein